MTLLTKDSGCAQALKTNNVPLTAGSITSFSSLGTLVHVLKFQ